MKLYELTTILESIWQRAGEVLDSEEAPNPETQAKSLSLLELELKSIEGTHAQKCLDIACMIKNAEAEAEAIAHEAATLEKRQKSLEKKAAWLRTYLGGNMEPGTNLKDARAVIAWRRSEAVEVSVNPSLLPVRFQRTKTVIDADKTAIKEALVADPSLPDLSGMAQVVTRFNLQIK